MTMKQNLIFPQTETGTKTLTVLISSDERNHKKIKKTDRLLKKK
jgi:hypothetical protein